jgi:hemolysin III
MGKMRDRYFGRECSRGEYIADAVIHVVGCIGAWPAAGMLVAATLSRQNPTLPFAALVYGASLILMLWASAAYNLARRPRLKECLRRLDHAAIFVMIAGTYTPFALAALRGPLGLGLLALVWAVALSGVALKLLRPRRYERLALALYLALGWCGLPLIRRLVDTLPGSAFVLLAAGGILYTGGVAFYKWERLPYHNAIWHAFVLAAAACHYASVYQVLTLPPRALV